MDGKFILGLCLGLIGSFLGALFAHIFSERRRRREEFNKAAIAFRTAFLPELIFLKHNAKIHGAASHSELNDFLNSGYLKHLEALAIFHNSLSVEQKSRINKAWQDYSCHADNPSMPFFEQYSWKVANKGKDYENQLKVLALNRIEKILEFAKPK